MTPEGSGGPDVVPRAKLHPSYIPWKPLQQDNFSIFSSSLKPRSTRWNIFHLVPALSTMFQLFFLMDDLFGLSGCGPSILQAEVGGWVGGIFLKLTSREFQRNAASMTRGLGCVMTETALVKCTVKQRERKGGTCHCHGWRCGQTYLMLRICLIWSLCMQ